MVKKTFLSKYSKKKQISKSEKKTNIKIRKKSEPQETTNFVDKL